MSHSLRLAIEGPDIRSRVYREGAKEARRLSELSAGLTREAAKRMGDGAAAGSRAPVDVVIHRICAALWHAHDVVERYAVRPSLDIEHTGTSAIIVDAHAFFVDAETIASAHPRPLTQETTFSLTPAQEAMRAPASYTKATAAAGRLLPRATASLEEATRLLLAVANRPADKGKPAFFADDERTLATCAAISIDYARRALEVYGAEPLALARELPVGGMAAVVATWMVPRTTGTAP